MFYKHSHSSFCAFNTRGASVFVLHSFIFSDFLRKKTKPFGTNEQAIWKATNIILTLQFSNSDSIQLFHAPRINNGQHFDRNKTWLFLVPVFQQLPKTPPAQQLQHNC